jgi:hypothetical protein
MRTRPSRERTESRIVHRYHKLYTPLIELVQSVEDLLPAGMQVDDTIELTKKEGEVLINCKARPVRLILHDKDYTFTLEVRKPARGNRG